MKKDIAEILKETVAVLKDGGTILYPTDTVWALGCDAIQGYYFSKPVPAEDFEKMAFGENKYKL